MNLRAALTVVALVAALTPAVALAADDIGAIRDHPEHYDGKTVEVEGRVGSVVDVRAPASSGKLRNHSVYGISVCNGERCIMSRTLEQPKAKAGDAVAMRGTFHVAYTASSGLVYANAIELGAIKILAPAPAASASPAD